MTKDQIKEWARDNELDIDKVLRHVDIQIKRYKTSYSVVSLYMSYASKTGSKYTSYGYRKNTTGEYVPHAYRRNFGWKNTYYQAARLELTLNQRDF